MASTEGAATISQTAPPKSSQAIPGPFAGRIATVRLPAIQPRCAGMNRFSALAGTSAHGRLIRQASGRATRRDGGGSGAAIPSAALNYPFKASRFKDIKVPLSFAMWGR